jgi:DNA-binding NtrC family response regulator
MMPRMDGYTLLKTLLERGDLTPAIVLTGLGSIREALAIVHDLRAFWFLEKPAQQSILAPLLERAIRQKLLMVETERLQRQLSLHGVLGDMVGTSEPMRQVFSLIQQVAPKTASVLISGESGTGKRASRGCDSQAKRQGRWPIHRNQLCRNSGKFDRKRAVRPRKRSLYRRHRTPGRLF